MSREDICLACPGICKPACPVYNVLPKLSVTPQGVIRTIALIGKGSLDYKDAYNLYECVMCGACVETCPINNPVTEMILDARGKTSNVYLEIRPPNILKRSGNRFVWIRSRDTGEGYLSEMSRIISGLIDDLTIVDGSGIYRAYYLGNRDMLTLYRDYLVSLLDNTNAEWIFTDTPELLSDNLGIVDEKIYLDMEVIFHHLMNRDVRIRCDSSKSVIYYHSCSPFIRNPSHRIAKEILELLDMEYIEGRDVTNINCCGAGGIFGETNTPISKEIRDALYNDLARFGEVIVLDNWRCKEHFSNEKGILHIFELIDNSGES